MPPQQKRNLGQRKPEIRAPSRREWLRASTSAIPLAGLMNPGSAKGARLIRITKAASNFERDRLARPFGFKGGYMTEKWQIATYLESESGNSVVGLCSQSVLWSDARVFASHSEAAGNALMYAMLDEAVQRVKNSTFRNPIELLERIYPRTYQHGVRITKQPDLRETFALMALVSLDNAAWLLYAKENGFGSYDEMLPAAFRDALSRRNDVIAAIPLISYTMPPDEIRQLAEEGYFFLKIKIGQPGEQADMLRKDMARLEQIHKTVGVVENPYTKDSKPRYYLDANGRYEQKSTLRKLLDHAEKIGARDHIAMIEEPFPEREETNVSDLGVIVAADESAHTDRSAEERIQMGYSAIAIKGAAKTLSMSLKIVQAATRRGVACFCADSSAIPILVDWNKNLAARLPAFPGLGLGLLETNGSQNYAEWDQLMTYHPRAGASWTVPGNGVFRLGEDFFEQSGGIFLDSPHYRGLFPS